MSFGPLTWRNGILTRYDFPGGFFSLYDDENEQPKLHPYSYITDHQGSVGMTVDGNGGNSGTENARQGMEYLPSGAILPASNYGAPKSIFSHTSPHELACFAESSDFACCCRWRLPPQALLRREVRCARL